MRPRSPEQSATFFAPEARGSSTSRDRASWTAWPSRGWSPRHTASTRHSSVRARPPSSASSRRALLVDGASLSFLPPLLPVLMAVVRNDAALAILLALLGALVAPACWALTNRHFGRAAAWIAAALAATEPSFVQWTPYLLTDL